MTEKRKIIEVCQNEVERVLNSQLSEIQKKICHLSSAGSVEELKTLLTEANSIISFICGPDDELYEQYHYRLFLSEQGKLFILQAEEIDVENFPYEINKDED